ncbi:3-oxoacyl-ACP synthase III family protein [Sulfitobacter sp. F26204]|uniref:3-oxoacyl-ACP synthase III family protein n=1 Tax=Sulfitobacter sp. F26204 TaxID=2996014 RepID=UPI00225E47F6|nr:3-oxoacyl-ACP synthase III family protein [Sulfitobacter sp. F26204]MCX7560540.1 3-oxoacyl-ACP synthase III family protein [Sulfitobacter sp. F26204]
MIRPVPETALITGTGRYLPGEPVGSDQLSQAMPTLPIDMFHQYFGVDTRHYVLDPATGARRKVTAENGDEVELTTTEMGALAALVALKSAGLVAQDVDAIITNSTTPDGMLPPFALQLQRRLNIENAQLLDVRGGCSASIQALNVAQMLVATGKARNVLIVSSECTSQYYLKKLREMEEPRFNDVVNGLLFADGASAVVVEASSVAKERDKDGFIIGYSGTQSCFADHKAGFSLHTKSDGRIETRHNHKAISATLPMVVARGYEELSKHTGRGPGEFDVTIIPQVNKSMVDLVSDAGSSPEELGFCYYGNETGNIPAAAMFMALDFARERGRIKPGDKIGILSIETTSWNYAVAELAA